MADPRAAWAQDTLRLLHTLPDDVIAVLIMIYLRRWDEKQICAQVGWTETRVRRTSSSGLRELGLLLERDSAGI